MKKYFLFLLIGFLTLIPVEAAKAKCVNLAEGIVFKETISTVPTKWYYYNPYLNDESFSLTVDTSKSYTFFFEDGVEIPDRFSVNGTRIVLDSGTTSYTFQPSSSQLTFSFQKQYSPISTLSSSTFWLVEGSEICSVESEPDPIVPDSTLDNFYSIYLDKLRMLSNYATENKFIFSAIGIIILFIVLEFFLILFKGRSRY